MMKTLLQSFLISLCMVLGTNSINGQCDNGTNYYPTTPFTPPPLAWSSAALDNWAGEVIPINVRTGYEYQFSTCGTYGGVTATYDTQLSLYDDNRNVVAFNDDFSGCTGYTSYVKWIATYDGVAYLHLNEYYCATNMNRTQVMIYSTPVAAPVLCANLDFGQDFESGNSDIAITSGIGGSGTINAASANTSAYGLQLQGNTSSYWYSPYSTGPDAFANSPHHISSASRDICAGTQPMLTLTFDKKQMSSYSVNYSWFRLTVNGIPVADNVGDIYFNRAGNSTWRTLTYDLSSYAGTDITVAWEFCGKYYIGYTSTGDGGDAVFIDNIKIMESTATPPPSVPGTIAGDDEPNEGTQNLVYTVALDNNVDTYSWTLPTNWAIVSGQGTNTITVAAGNYDGNISVVANNSVGSSSPRTLAVDVALIERVFPYSETFESETNDLTSASLLGFDFNANGWRNITGDHADWRTYSGTTPSSYTGTSGIDHSEGTSSGKYLYMESSSPMYPNKAFDLISPAFDLRSTTTPILTFWFNMETNNINSELALTYSLDNGTTWSANVNFMDNNVSSTANVIGDMGSNWRQGLVDLTFLNNERSVMFKITGTTGSTYSSDLCLDDIKLVDADNTSVDVGENLTISANYSGATGFVLNGTDAQVVTSNNSTIPDLTIDNSNGVTINGDITIDALTLTNGKITMNPINVLTAGSIAGTFNTNNHIIGSVKRTSTYPTYLIFPTGDGTNYRPIVLLPQNSTPSEYKVIYNNSSHSSVNFSQYPDGTPTGSNLHSIANGYYWDIEKSIGSAPARIGIGWDATMNVIAPTDIVVAHYNSTTNQWENIMGNFTSSGTASSGTALSDYTSDFSPFGFGSQGGGNALPVELLSFTGTERHGEVTLNWQVASQVNNDMFQIHKSLDAKDWEFVGAVKGNGNTNAEFSYYLIDNKPYTGRSYYQLTQVDHDGKSEVFKPITINVESTVQIVLSPNPALENVFLRSNEMLYGTTTITVINAIGKIMYEETFENKFNTLKIDLEDYTRGFYLLNIKNDQKNETLRFVKK